MPSIEDKISGILSDPDAVSKLKSLGAALGLGLEEEEKPSVKPEPKNTLGGLSSLLSSKKDEGDIVNTVMRLAPLLSDMNKEDDISRLLNSLRPFLSEARRSRLDDAGKMLRVMKILPVINNSGII